MVLDEAEWRRQRMAALADVLGGNAPLGRKLGYKDGAYVGQMISGLRPITEKTIAKAEAIRDEALPHGAAGWFSRSAVEPSYVAEAPTPTYAAIPPEYRRLLADLEDIPRRRRSALIDQIHQVAEEAREAAEHLGAARGKVAAARQPEKTRRTATTMKWGDGNQRQTSLPLLVPARDPFTAAPSDREAKFYRQVEQAPKAKRPSRGSVQPRREHST